MYDFVNWYWVVKDVKLICINKVVLIDIYFYINEIEIKMYVIIDILFDFEILILNVIFFSI